MKLALLAALLLAAPLGGSGHSANGLRDSHPCAGGYTCSTLEVPLDHSGRRAGTLQLAVGSTNNNDARRGVLLLITGGPGQPGVPSLARLPQLLGAELADYRVVVYDQRGTGDGALRCTGLQQSMGSSDLFPAPASVVRACAAKLGDRRQFFGTDDVVADMESLRKALGVDTWVLDGISYGSYVAERYALAHPTHVSKLVLDSVVPHVGLSDLGVVEFAATRRVLRAVCGSDRCAGDLATVIRQKHNGAVLLDALTFESIADPTYTTVFDVPRILHDAARGNTSELNEFLQVVHRYSAAPAEALDQGLHASALCADWRYPWGTSGAPLAGRDAKLRRAVAKLTKNQLYPYDRDTARNIGFVRQCLPWSPTAPTPAPRGKIRTPALLVNGDHDLSTPLEWARQQLKLMTRGKLVVVPGAGHSVQARAASDRGREAVADFLLR